MLTKLLGVLGTVAAGALIYTGVRYLLDATPDNLGALVLVLFANVVLVVALYVIAPEVEE